MLGAALLGVIGWFGYHYVAGQKISAEVIKFEVGLGHRGRGASGGPQGRRTPGVCTLRSQAEDGAEVGRKDSASTSDATRIDTVVDAAYDTDGSRRRTRASCLPAAHAGPAARRVADRLDRLAPDRPVTTRADLR